MSKRKCHWSTTAVMLALLTGCGPTTAKHTLPAANDEVSTPMIMEDVEASEDVGTGENIDADEDVPVSPDNSEAPATSN